VLNAAAVVALFKHVSGGIDVRWHKHSGGPVSPQ
jgi:hypothetical protein